VTLRVLVVEDDREIRSLMQSSLSVEGFEVQTAVTLSEAEALWRHSPPDVIVLDLGLPDGDGWACSRGAPAGSTPVIVVSARHQEAQKILLLDAGADDYLTKPFSVGELLARIRVALRHRGTALAPP
jgi:two-component system KDP operon response regulator KdpE